MADMHKISVMISEEELQAKISELGEKISADYEGKEVKLICILKGSVFFCCELAKRITVPVKIDFMQTSSYGSGTKSSGNIVINAEKSGEITEDKNIEVEFRKTSSVTVKYMDKDKPKINLRVKDVGDFVQVEIEDNGKGIASKDLPNVFERFYRTDASRNSSKGGSGIGLSIVKKIIEEHGGKIWATSREHTGTTMYFVLRKYQEVPVNE